MSRGPSRAAGEAGKADVELDVELDASLCEAALSFFSKEDGEDGTGWAMCRVGHARPGRAVLGVCSGGPGQVGEVECLILLFGKQRRGRKTVMQQ